MQKKAGSVRVQLVPALALMLLLCLHTCCLNQAWV